MSNKLKLLTEWAPFEYSSEMIKESKDLNGGKIIMKGILQKAETLNQNGRIYPKAILEREVRNYQKFIKESRALGECDHPDSSVVELKNASHIVREAHMDGDICYGTVELLDTPSGKILQSLVESGVTLGISSRGVGSTKADGEYQVVQDDFQLICWDFVSEPSTPGAFMMSEGVEVNKKDLNRHFTKTDRIDRIFNDILDWEKK
tara:strand:+ start:383 stop:997 length:615 start_codon:yes stop_codon:yes gene_type:complete